MLLMKQLHFLSQDVKAQSPVQLVPNKGKRFGCMLHPFLSGCLLLGLQCLAWLNRKMICERKSQR